MTQKELHRLRRQDVLQLLLAQSEETEQLKKELEETKEALSVMEANYERLRKRLDHKDEQIHHLRDMLEEHRKRRRIELEEAGSIAEAALRLNGIFEAAQKAADQYLYNLQLSAAERMQEEPEDDGMLEEDLPEDEGKVKEGSPEEVK